MIKVGDHIKTNYKYNEKMYEELYHEKILDGIVLSIDENNIVTYKLIKSSCNFNKRFNYLMYNWEEGSIKTIGLGWLDKI